eukprot:GHVQ01023118.1.p1 GENE.GHVQ01023118.1~~GHVQ01023118.1.p1  ORF type:complete len:361 (-),score=43.63 GHVQ01023118.1:108-1190(-)
MASIMGANSNFRPTRPRLSTLFPFYTRLPGCQPSYRSFFHISCLSKLVETSSSLSARRIQCRQFVTSKRSKPQMGGGSCTSTSSSNKSPPSFPPGSAAPQAAAMATAAAAAAVAGRRNCWVDGGNVAVDVGKGECNRCDTKQGDGEETGWLDLRNGNPEVVGDNVHFRFDRTPHPLKRNHELTAEPLKPVYSAEELNSVYMDHTPPACFSDKMAFWTVRNVRCLFDICTGYNRKIRQECMTEKDWVTRVIFLETVAGVPGMVGAMVRHLNSLRRMERDFGWIHTLLEEAENERMHLMTALLLRNPGWVTRLFVLLAQGAFLSWYSVCYMLSPKFCHRLCYEATCLQIIRKLKCVHMRMCV